MHAKAWTLVGGLLLICGAVWLGAANQVPAHLLAGYWQRQLPELPDRDVDGAVRRISQLGSPGLPVLVEALASPRPTVSAAAGRALHELLNQWKRTPIDQSFGNVRKLGSLLAERVPDLHGQALDSAGQLALRILSWPTPHTISRGGDLLTACAAVIRRQAEQASRSQRPMPGTAAPQLITPADTRASADTGASDRQDARVADRRVVPATGAEPEPSELPELPGGDLPLDLVQLPPLPPSLARPTTARPLVGDEPELTPPTVRHMPGLLFPERDAGSASDVNSGSEGLSEPGTPNLRAPASLDLSPPHAPRPLQPTAAANAAPPETALTLREHVRCLSDPDPLVRGASLRELERRGFGPLEIQLAERLEDPNPAVRRQLPAALERLPVRGTRWLLWLSEDPVASVRQEAVLRMATSQDPRLHQRLAEMEVTESDPLIRRQIANWARHSAQSPRVR